MELTITYQNGRESQERGEMRVIDVDESVTEAIEGGKMDG